MAQHIRTNENGDKRSFKRTSFERNEFQLPAMRVSSANEFQLSRKEQNMKKCLELAGGDVKKAHYIYSVYYM